MLRDFSDNHKMVTYVNARLQEELAHCPSIADGRSRVDCMGGDSSNPAMHSCAGLRIEGRIVYLIGRIAAKRVN